MENATKALLIAGGVLIAIIIITLLVRTYGNISNFQRQQLTQEEARQIAEFNSEYTQYENQYVYGTDVITVINKVNNYNQKEGTTKILIEVDDKEITAIGELGDFNDVKSQPYFCNEITYGEDGRVNKISFISKTIST